MMLLQSVEDPSILEIIQSAAWAAGYALWEFGCDNLDRIGDALTSDVAIYIYEIEGIFICLWILAMT